METRANPGRRREWADGVTLREFRTLAAMRGWSPETLLAHLAVRHADHFGGPRGSRFYETPLTYLKRVLRRAHARDDETVIPYRGLIQVYVEETTPRLPESHARWCACGCGSPVIGRHRYATATCRVRAHRQRVSAVTDCPNGPTEAQQNREPTRYILPDPHLHPSVTVWDAGAASGGDGAAAGAPVLGAGYELEDVPAAP